MAVFNTFLVWGGLDKYPGVSMERVRHTAVRVRLVMKKTPSAALGRGLDKERERLARRKIKFKKFLFDPIKQPPSAIISTITRNMWEICSIAEDC